MTQDHERQLEAAEREIAELEERSEQVGQEIDEARKDWEAKVADPSVPGAGGDPDRADTSPDAHAAESRGDDDKPPPDPTETD
jgi:hypothetical protein